MRYMPVRASITVGVQGPGLAGRRACRGAGEKEGLRDLIMVPGMSDALGSTRLAILSESQPRQTAGLGAANMTPYMRAHECALRLPPAARRRTARWPWAGRVSRLFLGRGRGGKGRGGFGLRLPC